MRTKRIIRTKSVMPRKRAMPHVGGAMGKKKGVPGVRHDAFTHTERIVKDR